MLEYSNSFWHKNLDFTKFSLFDDLGTSLTQDLECKGDLFKYLFNNAAFHQEDLFRKGNFMTPLSEFTAYTIIAGRVSSRSRDIFTIKTKRWSRINFWPS